MWEPSAPAEVTIFSKPYVVTCDLVKDFSLSFLYVASLTKNQKEKRAVTFQQLLLLDIKFHEVRVVEE